AGQNRQARCQRCGAPGQAGIRFIAARPIRGPDGHIGSTDHRTRERRGGSNALAEPDSRPPHATRPRVPNSFAFAEDQAGLDVVENYLAPGDGAIQSQRAAVVRKLAERLKLVLSQAEDLAAQVKELT